MSDTPAILAAAPPLDDLFATKRPELLAVGRGYHWSPKAKPLTGAHALLRIFLFIYMAVQAFMVIELIAMLYLFYAVSQGADGRSEMLQTLAIGVALGGQYLPLALPVVLIGCVIFYSMFVFRGMKNLDLSHARNLTISPGWAVGWSFVPFANFGMIFSAMKQIWVGSHDPSRGAINAPGTLIAWWALWLGGGFLNFVANGLTPKESDFTTPKDIFSLFLPGATIALLSTTTAIISTLCLMSIIRQITTAQEVLRSTSAFDE